jgi:hypothetical protein
MKYGARLDASSRCDLRHTKPNASLCHSPNRPLRHSLQLSAGHNRGFSFSVLIVKKRRPINFFPFFLQ